MQYIILTIGCYRPDFHGDGFCHDYNNNEACFFDGGDCYGLNTNMIYCTECATRRPPDCANLDWVSDGFCDDVTNNQECNFDGGDCCGPNIDTKFCIECRCLQCANPE